MLECHGMCIFLYPIEIELLHPVIYGDHSVNPACTHKYIKAHCRYTYLISTYMKSLEAVEFHSGYSFIKKMKYSYFNEACVEYRIRENIHRGNFYVLSGK